MKYVAKRSITKVAGASPSTNEDVFFPKRHSGLFTRFVLCDGATTSFAGRVWAEALAKSFFDAKCRIEVDTQSLFFDDDVFKDTIRREILSGIVDSAVRKYEKKFDFSKLSFFKQEAYKRGSASTVLFLEQEISNPEILHVTTVGDSCVFIMDSRNVIVQSFPMTEASEFSTSAYLVGSNGELRRPLFDPATYGLYWKQAEFNLASYPDCRIVCATDAVSQWLLANRSDGEKIGKFISLLKRSMSDYSMFIDEQRQRGAMAVDDSTVVVLEK